MMTQFFFLKGSLCNSLIGSKKKNLDLAQSKTGRRGFGESPVFSDSLDDAQPFASLLMAPRRLVKAAPESHIVSG